MMVDSQTSFKEYLLIVRKHIWTVVFIFLTSVTVTVVWNLKATPIFRSSLQILISPDIPKVVTFQEVSGRERQLAEYYATEHKLLESEQLGRRVVTALGLAKVKGFGIPDDNNRDILRESINYVMDTVLEMVKSKPGANELIVRKVKLSPEDKALSALLKTLTIKPIQRTRLVTLHIEYPNPVLAQKIASTYGNKYLEMNLDLRYKTNESASAWLKDEIQKVREKLISSETALQKYKEKYNIVSLESRQNIITQKLSELNSTVTKSKTNMIDIELLASIVRSANGNIDTLNSLPYILDNSVIQSLKKNLIIQESQYSELSKKYKKRHPKLVRLASRINLERSKINREVRTIGKNIMTRYRIAKDREASLSRSLESQKQEALRLNQLAIQYGALKRDSETNLNLYQNILIRLKETSLLKGIRTSNLRIIDNARVPKFAVRPKKFRNILLSAFISLGFGIMFVFFLETFDTRIKSPLEAEEILDAPILGTLPFMKLSRRENEIFDENTRNYIGREHFKEIQTLSLFRFDNQHKAGNQHKAIQITSCVPGEGKTLISSNLASMFSGITGKKTLLIDGDIHRIGVNAWYDIPSSPGLLDVLFNQASIEEAIHPVPGSNLEIMPSGEAKHISSKLFESSSLRNILKELKRNYDYILIDTPPILVVSDPLVWAFSVDGILFVVDIKQVTQEMLRQANRKIKELDVPIFGTVLNNMTQHHNYYCYGYDKKYSYYYSGGGRNT